MKYLRYFILLLFSIVTIISCDGITDPNANPLNNIIYGKNKDIFIMNLDGSQKKNLTNDIVGSKQFSDVSLKNNQILFTNSIHESVNIHKYYIYLMDVDGNNKINLNNLDLRPMHPRFSNDGSKITFLATQDYSGEVYIMNVDGTNLKNITNNNDRDMFPIFAKDDNSVHYISEKNDLFDLYKINLSTMEKTNLTNDGSLYGANYIITDYGSYIFYNSSNDGQSNIYKMNIKGKEKTKLSNTFGNTLCDVTFNGSKFLYYSWNENGNDIVLESTYSSSKKTIARIKHVHDWWPNAKFSPFEGKIIFTDYTSLYNGNSEIFITNVNGGDKINLTNSEENEYLYCVF